MQFIKISKKHIFYLIFLILFCLIFSTHPSYSNENDGSSDASLVINPFSLQKKRAILGKEFRINIQKELFKEEIPINEQLKDTKVILEYKTIDEEGYVSQSENKINKGDIFLQQSGKHLDLIVIMPSWDEIEDIRAHKWRGILRPYKAQLKINYQMNKEQNVITLSIEIPDTRWAVIWGLIAVVASFFLIFVFLSLSGAKEKRVEKTDSLAKRIFLFPLRFTITPIGTYSVSITQILLWTYVTIFGIVYVYWISGVCLEITPQILVLLGIGGGTALGAKINALSRVEEIPSKYLDLVDIEKRRPELQDLISIGDKLNIFKFQVLVFTIIIAYLVVVEIIKTGAFPVIPANHITLMGLSSVVYLGNEVTQKDKKDLWKEVKEKIAYINDWALKKKKPIENAQQIEALKIKEVGELKSLLRQIYE